MGNTYVITEYESFVCEKALPGYKSLPQKTFEQLERFILENRNGDTDAVELMGISAKKGAGKVITAKNYVGVISMTDGTTIEILPKLCADEAVSEEQVKKLLVKMIRTLRNAPYKSLQTSLVDTAKMNLFEIYIRMFIDEIFTLAKRGLKSDYRAEQSNERTVKGKLVFGEQVRKNAAHRERVFVEYDVFDVDRAENRLIKAALQYLYRKTGSTKNKADLKTLLGFFGEVGNSPDYKKDLSACKSDRNTADYKNAILWSAIFLAGKSFTSFAGSSVAYALLFPMEMLFENYIAKLVKMKMQGKDYAVFLQDKRHHLFDEPGKKFLMKPDIVLVKKDNKKQYLFDTKWKLLSESAPNYGISQADMYQMYAYQQKYGAESVTLLYPKTDRVKSDAIEYRSHDTLVRARFIDLFDEASIGRVLDGILPNES